MKRYKKKSKHLYEIIKPFVGNNLDHKAEDFEAESGTKFRVVNFDHIGKHGITKHICVIMTGEHRGKKFLFDPELFKSWLGRGEIRKI